MARAAITARTTRYLREEVDAESGELILAACADIDAHIDNGRCPWDLGARRFSRRLHAVLDASGRPALDDQGREFLDSRGDRPAVTVLESRPNLTRHAKALLEVEAKRLRGEL